MQRDARTAQAGTHGCDEGDIRDPCPGPTRTNTNRLIINTSRTSHFQELVQLNREMEENIQRQRHIVSQLKSAASSYNVVAL